jgi:hypothetical protein
MTQISDRVLNGSALAGGAVLMSLQLSAVVGVFLLVVAAIYLGPVLRVLLGWCLSLLFASALVAGLGDAAAGDRLALLTLTATTMLVVWLVRAERTRNDEAGRPPNASARGRPRS